LDVLQNINFIKRLGEIDPGIGDGMKLAMEARALPVRRSREISGGQPAKGSNQWILAGFQDDICCREVLR
jgi:hypothetical protein